MASVGVRELKAKLSYYLKCASRGEHIIVTHRGRQVAVVAPPEESETERHLMELVNEGVASWMGGKPAGSPQLIQGKGKPLSEIVLEERR
jgi:prevent-host-death family protein